MTLRDFERVSNELVRVKEENQKLKKQLEVSTELIAQDTLTVMKLRNEFNRRRKEYQDTYKDVCIEIKEYKTQQKEFIKYLEDESKEIYRDGGLRQNIFRQILQKYKEIIGVLNEKEN